MNHLSRRGFLKTCVVSAAGAGYCRDLQGLNLLPADDKPGSFANLENGPQRLQVSPAGEICTFQNFLRVANEWRPTTLPGISPVTGPSFPLRAASISRSDSVLKCRGS